MCEDCPEDTGRWHPLGSWRSVDRARGACGFDGVGAGWLSFIASSLVSPNGWLIPHCLFSSPQPRRSNAKLLIELIVLSSGQLPPPASCKVSGKKIVPLHSNFFLRKAVVNPWSKPRSSRFHNLRTTTPAAARASDTNLAKCRSSFSRKPAPGKLPSIQLAVETDARGAVGKEVFGATSSRSRSWSAVFRESIPSGLLG